MSCSSYRVVFEITSFKPCRKNDIIVMLKAAGCKCSVRHGTITAKTEFDVPRRYMPSADTFSQDTANAIFGLNHDACDNDRCTRCEPSEPCVVEARCDDLGEHHRFDEDDFHPEDETNGGDAN